jgi:sterol desaturase/sphingolipid hydroxylase (fatty acid hydroxylase superfamily)
MTCEWLWPAQKKAFFRRGLFTDGLYVVINILLRIAFTNTIAVMFTRFATEHAPSWMPVALLDTQPLWLQVVVLVVVLDFFFYWMHRAKHRWDWWYRLHETHHSSEELDWFSSVRFHPLEKILDRCIYLFPLLFIGASEEALLILAIIDAAVASFSHANFNLRFGPLKYVIVGPEMHRWHHTPTAEGQFSNFGNNLSVFDWLFGTARLHADWPAKFGIGEPTFPEGSFLKQFVWAFRPFPAKAPAERGGEPAPARSAEPG